MAITTYTKKSNTIKMDKEFDFSSFVAKPRVMGSTPEISETNTIKDEEFKKGLLKTIILAGNGVFEVVDSKYGFSVKNQGGDYPGLGAAYDSLSNGCFVTENPAPKLPRKAIETVIEWYKRITHKNGEEAQVNFYWNQYKQETVKDDDGNEQVIKDIPGVHYWTEDLFSYTPLQYNSGALTEVADSDEWYDVFNRNFGMYVETHSHNSMNAFASGTDEENSSNDGFQLVFGLLNTDKLVMYSWMTMNRVMRLGMTEEELGKIMETNPSSTYDESKEQVIYDVSDLDFDESLFDEWDKQVIKRPISVSTYIHGPTTTNYNVYSYDGHTTNYTYTRGTYTQYSQKEEIEAVEDLFDATLSESLLHQILLSNNQKVDYTKVSDMLRAAFVAGYMAKKAGPYSISSYTYPKLEIAVQNEASTILDQFYELEE